MYGSYMGVNLSRHVLPHFSLEQSVVYLLHWIIFLKMKWLIYDLKHLCCMKVFNGFQSVPKALRLYAYSIGALNYFANWGLYLHWVMNFSPPHLITKIKLNIFFLTS